MVSFGSYPLGILRFRVALHTMSYSSPGFPQKLFTKLWNDYQHLYNFCSTFILKKKFINFNQKLVVTDFGIHVDPWNQDEA